MYSIMETRDGKFVGRSHRRLRRDERPGANARVLGAEIRGSKLESGSQCEQRKFENGSSSSDGTNLADSDSWGGERSGSLPYPYTKRNSCKRLLTSRYLGL